MPDVKPTPPINPFKKTQSSTRKAILISTIAIILAIVTGIVAWFAWTQAYDISRHLNKYANIIQKRSTKAIQSYENRVVNLQKQLEELQNKFSDAQKKINQLEAINLQSEDQHSFSEVAYLIHLANLHLIVTQNASAALNLLEAAQTQLNKISNQAVSELKHAIAKDIVELQKVPRFDMTTLLTRLQKLKEAIANLPALPDQKMKAPDKTSSDADNTSLPWYKKMGHNLLGLKELIIIRHDKRPIKPLLSPEQLIFLKENVQLKIAESEWGALHQNNSVYQQGLTSAKQMLEQFYPNQQAMVEVLNEINALLNENIAPKLPDLSNTLKILHTTSLYNNRDITPTKPSDKKPEDQ